MFRGFYLPSLHNVSLCGTLSIIFFWKKGSSLILGIRAYFNDSSGRTQLSFSGHIDFIQKALIQKPASCLPQKAPLSQLSPVGLFEQCREQIHFCAKIVQRNKTFYEGLKRMKRNSFCTLSFISYFCRILKAVMCMVKFEQA